MGGELKLSICILAYNQPDDVDRLLARLENQVGSNVEIVIRDDSECDETSLIVSKYAHINNLRYIRGVKAGIDKTVAFLVEEARGEFVWWMGDDDIVDGGVEKVLSVIETVENVGFIWANYKLFETDIRGINIDENRLFVDPDEIILEAGLGLGFISACVLRKEIAIQALVKAEEYDGTAFANLYIALFTIFNGNCSYCISDVVVICHPASSEEIKSITAKNPNKINNRAFEVFGINFYKIVKSFSADFKRATTVRRVIKKSFGKTWRGVLVGWSGGWDTPKNKRILLLKHFWSFPEVWIAFVLFCMPAWVNKSTYSLYRKGKYGWFSR